MSKDDFFIGWADTPKPDRRFFLGAGLSLLAGTAATGTALAALQNRPGPGTWDQAAVREWRGIATSDPYAMLRTTDFDGTPRTALLACLGKCGVAARIGSYAGQQVVVKGSLIQRGEHRMIAVVDGLDWIRADDADAPSDLAFPELAYPAPAAAPEVTLAGEILDSKCWFGAMRPSEGKVHKACAALCIRGGIPPAFFAKDRAGNQTLLIMTHRGEAHGPDLLPYVADPVQIRGRILRYGDLTLLDGPVADITRLA